MEALDGDTNDAAAAAVGVFFDFDADVVVFFAAAEFFFADVFADAGAPAAFGVVFFVPFFCVVRFGANKATSCPRHPKINATTTHVAPIPSGFEKSPINVIGVFAIVSMRTRSGAALGLLPVLRVRL